MSSNPTLLNVDLNPAFCPPVSGTAHTARTPGSGMARFWDLRGRRVFQAQGVMWGAYRKHLYVSLPFHRQLHAGAREMDAMLREFRVPVARFPSSTCDGLTSGLFVCRPQGYGIDAVSRKQRGHVRKGLESCEIRTVHPHELLREGLELNLDTMRRHNRFNPEFGQPHRWSQFVDALRQCPELNVTGAFVDGRLSVYVISVQEDGWLHLLHKNSRTADLHLSTNHALDYSILERAGRDPSIEAVANYFSTFLSNPGLDQYKRQLGFTPVPHNLCVYIHPTVAPFLANPLALSGVKAVRKFKPLARPLASGAILLEGAMITHKHSTASEAVTNQPCQHEDGLKYSRVRRPHSLFLLWWYTKKVRKLGLAEVLRQVPRFLSNRVGRKLRRRPASAPRPLAPSEVLGLKPGDWVEVKTEAEILATLDKNAKSRGLLFAKEQRVHYGRRFKVLRRVERIFMEESKQNRTLKNTVLLDSVHCNGIDLECDKYCFFFWKEAWLKRVDGPGTEPGEPLIQIQHQPVSTYGIIKTACQAEPS